MIEAIVNSKGYSHMNEEIVNYKGIYYARTIGTMFSYKGIIPMNGAMVNYKA